jgi:hypothetical protein
MSAVADRLSRFLIDLAAADPRDLYERQATPHTGPSRRSLEDRVAGEGTESREGT